MSKEKFTDSCEALAFFLDRLPKATNLDPSKILIALDGIRPDLYKEDNSKGHSHKSYFGKMRNTKGVP